MIRMKKNLFTTGALVAALAMAATSCSNEELATDNGGKVDKKGGITEITAGTPQEAPGTRLTYEHLSAGGLKVEWEAQSSSNTEEFYAASFLNGSTSYYKLIQSDNAPKASSSSFKVMYYNNGWSDGAIDSNEEIHALYPVKAAYEGVFQNNASTALSAPNLALDGQTGKLTDMKNFDYMTVVTTATATLSLQFKHRIAVLCLKGLTFNGLSGNEAISSFSISGIGVKPSAKLTITQGATTDAIAFTGIADAAIATSGSTFAITSGTQSENAYICFFPNAAMNEQEITVSATVGSDTYTCTFTVPPTGFLEGNMYTLSGKTMTKSEPYSWYIGKSSPYIISNEQEMLELANVVNNTNLSTGVTQNTFRGKTLLLSKDLDMNGIDYKPIGASVSFEGTFDGQNHSISNLTIDTPSSDYVGIFGRCSSTSILKNLTLESGTITGKDNVGGLVGYISGTIIGCVNKATIIGKSWSGGLAGDCLGNIIACENMGAIQGSSQNGGGIAGIAEGSNSTICACINYGNIEPTAGYYYGGIIGNLATLKEISACLNEGEISSSFYSGALFGKYSANVTKELYYVKGSKATGYTGFTQTSSTYAEVNAKVAELNECITEWNTANPTLASPYIFQASIGDNLPILIKP